MGRYRKIYMLGGEVCAVHTSERIRKILTMSGVTKIMQIYEECTFRINGAPFPRQRCKRLAPAVRYPFVVTC